jgi:hypothetical protein
MSFNNSYFLQFLPAFECKRQQHTMFVTDLRLCIHPEMNVGLTPIIWILRFCTKLGTKNETHVDFMGCRIEVWEEKW